MTGKSTIKTNPALSANLARENRTIRNALARMGDRLDSAITLLSAISSLTQIPVQANEMNQAAEMIVTELVRNLPDVNNCSIMIHCSASNLLDVMAAKGRDEVFGLEKGSYNKGLSFTPGEGVAGKVFLENKAVFWDRSSPEKSLLKQDPNKMTPVSLACLPVTTLGRCIGVLNISFAEMIPFDLPRRRELELLSQVVGNLLETCTLKKDLNLKASNLSQKVEECEIEIRERLLAESSLQQTEAMLRLVLDNIPQQISWKSLKLTYLGCNKSFADAAGFDSPEEVIGKAEDRMAWGLAQGRDNRAKDLEVLDGTSARSDTLEPQQQANGKNAWLNSSRIRILNDQEELLGLLVSSEDVTEQQKAKLKNRLWSKISETTLEGIVILDEKGCIQTVNQSFTELTGYSQQELLTEPFESFVTLVNGPPDVDSLAGLVKPWMGEIKGHKKEGGFFPALAGLNPISNDDGKIIHYVAILHDLTKIKQSEEQITYQAFHDLLTGLPNRRLFSDRLQVALNHASRHSLSLAILSVDLDNFKDINDVLGPNGGDYVLRTTANRLLGTIREEDTAARLGSDEFLVLLHGRHGSDYAIHTAERIISNLGSPLKYKDKKIYITCSIGVTLHPHDGTRADTLITNAQLAMHRAKKQGRSNYQLFTQNMNSEAMRRVHLDHSLRRALENQELEVFYQPKVDLQTGQVFALEALIRWQEPGGKIIPPDEFIPLAEESGLIIPLGAWILEESCNQARRLNRIFQTPLRMSVNLSPRQFKHRQLARQVDEILERTKLRPDLLELEITESAMAKNPAKALRTLHELSELDIYLSMDDFGKGYSSLYNLKTFPINSLKIDGSFIRGLPNDLQDAAIVKTVITLGESMGIEVLAEGVETREQHDFLIKQGCRQGQGYLYSPPAPAKNLDYILSRPLIS
ncbi:bifunctional diguanylate cyclase/phosphodiesterase [Dethiosulfatarculus sandiegensis]|uniref:Diguanylate cyclase n=1 Tax=Dethiosulfatarculus sandiegensis TaxID=1429043 RepID=A0A0D2JAT5_9BACT|nr:EAL domain-containing protein [Dethiosulfatarculus sandiegensis]KIX12841.1 hypothetical protein X474_17260 [Dethiosulfatarculus sandiegensis]